MNTPNGNSGSNSSQRSYKAIKEHLFSELNDEAVILSLKNGRYYGLNAVGVSIWRALQEPATIDEIEAAVMNEFEVDQDVCEREVSTFLESMAVEQLIEVIDEKSI